MPAAPQPLPENSGLVFLGEAEWAHAIISARQAETLAANRNPAGRPNSDVLRSFVGRTGHRIREHWQIDFPVHYNEQEAALHERPFALLKKSLGPTARDWWINPHAQPPLRHALARLDRFLATALDVPEPAWTWFASEHLPDASLLVVARDDDFTHAVLQSTVFTTWWHAHRASLTPVQLIESFPFPWPPFTPFGSLTKAQQERRSATSRAGLADKPEQLDFAVTSAYDWPPDLPIEEIRARLRELNRQRAG